MADFFTSGRIVDIAIALALLEGLGVALYRWRTGRGPALRPFLVNLAAGLCLMLALRAALVGAGWGWVAAALVGSLLAHGADLAWRWRVGDKRPPSALTG
ncbi:hypothetical protein HHL28_02460 [Aerophototrophica crusticola]|uniref:Uncharacterized protein n=1 Tax=Aerophototrophica crusticola TaxID=1709002 RepID=A0A858RAL8_9PROT|nr:hypothetical protein HHL28_02460 [Rhodospirillaceae bacterium B3]